MPAISSATQAPPTPSRTPNAVASPGTDRAMNGLAAGRILLGVSALAAPARLVGAFGLPTSPALDYMTRIYGGRAIALGAGYLSTPPDQRGRWHRLGLFVDVADTITAIGHLARRDIPRPTAAALGTLTGGYALVGLLRLLGQPSTV
jgi:hypothetical protein